MPWVRLHGTKDYFGMAKHLLEVPGVPLHDQSGAEFARADSQVHRPGRQRSAFGFVPLARRQSDRLRTGRNF